MKRSIALLLVLVLALSFVLVSCGTKTCDTHVDDNIDEICDVCEAAVPFTPTYLGFKDIYNTVYESDEKEALIAAVKVDKLNGMKYSSKKSAGNLAVFENDEAKAGSLKLAVLNTDTGAVVLELFMEKYEGTDPYTSRKSAEVITCGSNYFIKLTYDSWNNPYSGTLNVVDNKYHTYEYTYYTDAGNVIGTTKSSSEVPSYYYDNFITFAGNYYLIENGEATKKFENDLVDIPYYDVKSDKYYYDFNTQMMGVSSVNIYDQNFKLLEVYKAPFDAQTAMCYILADGSILTQSIFVLPEDAVDYDVYQIGTNQLGEAYTLKYDIKTTVYNVETKETVEHNVNYVIVDEYFTNKLDESFADKFVSDKIENVTVIVEIVDGKLDNDKSVYANIRTSDLRVLGYLGQEIPEQNGLATLFDDNRFIVKDKANRAYLIDENAKILGEVTNAQYNNPLVDECKFMRGTRYYDSDLKLIVDTVDNAKYSRYYLNSGYLTGIYTYSYRIFNVEENGYVKSTDYYYRNSDLQMVDLKLTLAEANTLMSDTGCYAYLNAVVQNPGTENATTKRTWVVYNDEGTKIFELDPAAVETTDAETSKKITSTEKITGVETLQNGSVVIYVTKTIKTEGVTEDKYENYCYFAK